MLLYNVVALRFLHIIPMPFTAPQSIESSRTRLRIVEASDLPALLRVNGDDEVTRYLPYATWLSQADAQAWYERIVKAQGSGTALQFAVIEKASDQVIGTCLLFRYDEGSQRAELGYVLGRQYWGTGLMLDALQALLGHAFHVMHLRRVEAEVNPANTASVHLLERLGFTREGLQRQRWVDKGQAYDVAVFGLLRDEYPCA